MWQCRFVDAKGVRCPAQAVRRIHFATEHPFDHTDVCPEHLEEYKFFCWYEPLCDEKGKERVQ